MEDARTFTSRLLREILREKISSTGLTVAIGLYCKSSSGFFTIQFFEDPSTPLALGLVFCKAISYWMRELVDTDSASVPAASTSGNASQQCKIVSRGNHAAESVGPAAR